MTYISNSIADITQPSLINKENVHWKVNNKLLKISTTLIIDSLTGQTGLP